jgi:hypothetical protein
LAYQTIYISNTVILDSWESPWTKMISYFPLSSEQESKVFCADPPHIKMGDDVEDFFSHLN